MLVDDQISRRTAKRNDTWNNFDLGVSGVGRGRETQEIGDKDLRTRKALEEKVVEVGGFWFVY